MLVSPDFRLIASLNRACSPCVGCIVLLESLAHDHDSCNSNRKIDNDDLVGAGFVF